VRTVNILVVDDEDDFRETLVKRLSKRNYSVRGAVGGQQALDMMSEEPADVVLLDMKMPGMDGIQTLHALKKKFPAAQVIILTGHASLESSKDGLRLGAYDYLIKPSTLDEILIKIQESQIVEGKHPSV
jgi:DNA-binding NtrC family response regulator